MPEDFATPMSSNGSPVTSKSGAAYSRTSSIGREPSKTFQSIGGVVIVLGELGRSTRAVNICTALAEHHPERGYILVGYYDEFPLNHTPPENILISRIPRYEGSVLPGPLHLVLKTIYLTFQVFFALRSIPACPYLYIQNPPSIPVLLAVVMLRLCLKFTKMSPEIVVDWHNLGGSREPAIAPFFTKFSYRYLERILGTYVPTYHLSVSCAMSHYLQTKMKLHRRHIRVLYDQPTNYEQLDNLNGSRRSEFEAFRQYFENPLLAEKHPSKHSPWKRHQNIGGMSVHLSRRSDEPHEGDLNVKKIIMMMGSSFTTDEGTQELVLAISRVDRAMTASKITDRRLLIIVTGEGPNLSAFQALIQSLDWSHVDWFTGYLSAEDYWRSLYVCDIGLSLFFSSSGLDIPMKAYDLVGAHVPNCVYWDYGTPMDEFIDFVTQEESNYHPCEESPLRNDYQWVGVSTQDELESALLNLSMNFETPKQLIANVPGNCRHIVYNRGPSFSSIVNEIFDDITDRDQASYVKDKDL